MAKKKPTIDVFKNTSSAAQQQQPLTAQEDIIDAKGVGLKKSEWGEIEQRAQELGITRHKLAAILLRYGLDHLRNGKIKTKTEKTISLDI